jgi:hypothetical protein
MYLIESARQDYNSRIPAPNPIRAVQLAAAAAPATKPRLSGLTKRGNGYHAALTLVPGSRRYSRT